MHLSDYLTLHNLSAAAFGREVGVTRSAVVRWITGKRSPNSAAMQAIIKASGGKVQPNDFFEVPANRPAPKSKAA